MQTTAKTQQSLIHSKKKARSILYIMYGQVFILNISVLILMENVKTSNNKFCRVVMSFAAKCGRGHWSVEIKLIFYPRNWRW